MIPVKNGLTNEQGGIAIEAAFGAKAENMGMIFQILRSQLYSDEPRAVIREYSTNAVDAHISVGKGDLPIQVTLPTTLDSFLKIRDFGPGLTDEEVINIYTSYGESTKRNNAAQNGMLGIGCKSGFAYGDSFIINSYKDGTLTAWNCYLTPENDSKMAQMAKVETTEANGIEVVIPVRGADVAKFREKAIRVYAHFEVLPNIVNIEGHEKAELEAIRNKPSIFEGTDWKYVGGDSQSYAVMANVAYPINADVFNDTEIRDETKQLLRGGLIIKFKNGEVEFSASREALKYTAFTKKRLASRLTDITNELVKLVEDKFVNCKTLWEAKLLYKEVFQHTGKLYYLRSVMKNNLTFNGYPLTDNPFRTDGGLSNDGKVEHSIYHKPYTSAKVKRDDNYMIEPATDILVVVNDTNIVNGIVNRIVGLIEAGPKYRRVHVLKFVGHHLTDAALMAKWKKDTGYDGPMVSLATLPKEPLSKYYPTLASSGVGGFTNSKHLVKEFSYIIGNRLSSGNNRSEFWTPETVDLKKDAGVYLELDRFEFINQNGGTSHPYKLRDLLEKLKAAGIPLPPKIYGFKRSSAETAEDNPNMVTLWDWLKDKVVASYNTNPDVAAMTAKYDYVREQMGNWQSGLIDIAKAVAKWNIEDKSPLAAFCQKVAGMHRYNEQTVVSWKELFRLVGATMPPRPAVADLKPEWQKMASRYPLLFLSACTMGGWRITSEGWEKALVDYITLMDLATP